MTNPYTKAVSSFVQTSFVVFVSVYECDVVPAYELVNRACQQSKQNLKLSDNDFAAIYFLWSWCIFCIEQTSHINYNPKP